MVEKVAIQLNMDNPNLPPPGRCVYVYDDRPPLPLLTFVVHDDRPVDAMTEKQKVEENMVLMAMEAAIAEDANARLACLVIALSTHDPNCIWTAPGQLHKHRERSITLRTERSLREYRSQHSAPLPDLDN